MKIKSLISLAALTLTTAATAQNLSTGYFNEGYLYRHELNPAFGNDQSYVSMPAVGNVNFKMGSNIGVDNILYKVNGRTALFLNPQVSKSEFLSGVNSNNRVSQSLKEQLMGVGFKGMGGYNTIEVNVREDFSANVPGTALRLAKEGLQNKQYDISDINAHADAYGEIAFGHSRQINENLRIGAKVKMLLGIGNIDANFNKAVITLGEDKYTAVVDAKLQTSLNNMHYKIKEKERGAEGEETMHKYVSGIDDTSWGICGYGLAADFGAEYKLDKNWKFSAAFLDLGFIGYKNNFVASTNGTKTVDTDNYIFNLDDKSTNSFENEGDRLAEDFASIYELQDNGNIGSRTKAIAATMNLGAQYTPDFYDKMNFGLMNSTRFAGKYTWTEFTLSANVAPTKAFSASASLAAGTYGTSFGWLINVHPNGFNLFVGMDHVFNKAAKQGLPLSGNGSVSMGINFPF